ncbi:hypothetical protein B0T22DRAFT_143109 [Podospora appendiculata]|uniref:DOMON domain-containing protein n=1 Tax=Podospora appendiculata TaxID=314037 RepID=A0AAE1CC22_9PEZI|nr:hypothetical protein B0T22DRAFT_143109 [Podospora appendiculata]
MMIFTRSSPALTWLLLCLAQVNIVKADDVSTLSIRESRTQFSINLPQDSQDVNFYLSAPDLYAYTAFGFGSSMANALMLVFYPSADYSHVTVSPRLSTGNSEPAFYPNVELTIYPGSFTDTNGTMTVNGTCHACRSWGSGSIDVESTTQPMIFAYGPTLGMGSDDVSAPLRRHMGHGHFTMNMVTATGPGGITTVPQNITKNAVFSGGIIDDSDKAATAHGVLFALIALAVAPFDTLVAGLTKRWPAVHTFTSTIYFLMVIGAMVPGILVSKEYFLTQKFQTAHQILGLMTIIIMFGLAIWGVFLNFVRSAAKKRGQEPPERSALMGKIHRLGGWFIWVLFLINNGLGLQLANQGKMFILGYAVIAVGVVLFTLPIYWCIWRCTRSRTAKEEDAHELNIYDHQYH